MSIKDHLIKLIMWWQGAQKLRNGQPPPLPPRQFRHCFSPSQHAPQKTLHTYFNQLLKNWTRSMSEELVSYSKVATRLWTCAGGHCLQSSKYKTRNHNDGHDDFLLNYNLILAANSMRVGYYCSVLILELQQRDFQKCFCKKVLRANGDFHSSRSSELCSKQTC